MIIQKLLSGTKYLICILFIVYTPLLYGQPVEKIKISPDLELIRLSQNAYIHVSYAELPGYGRTAANGLIFINKRKAFLFDTPWNDSLTSGLVSYLENKMELKIEGFIPNHWHDDCIGGLAYIRGRGIKTYANQLTTIISRQKGLPLADKSFNDSIRIKLGNKAIYCWYPGPAHSMDNIVAWIPSEKLLFAGCMCKSMDAKNPGNTADGDTSLYRNTIDAVIRKFSGARIVIPGHGAAGGQELLLHTRSLIP